MSTHAEPVAGDTVTLELPKDLLAELNRRGPLKSDELRVEGWKPSLLGRLAALLTGKSGH